MSKAKLILAAMPILVTTSFAMSWYFSLNFITALLIIASLPILSFVIKPLAKTVFWLLKSAAHILKLPFKAISKLSLRNITIGVNKIFKVLKSALRYCAKKIQSIPCKPNILGFIVALFLGSHPLAALLVAALMPAWYRLDQYLCIGLGFILGTFIPPAFGLFAYAGSGLLEPMIAGLLFHNVLEFLYFNVYEFNYVTNNSTQTAPFKNNHAQNDDDIGLQNHNVCLFSRENITIKVEPIPNLAQNSEKDGLKISDTISKKLTCQA